jgi:hypothetical protein
MAAIIVEDAAHTNLIEYSSQYNELKAVLFIGTANVASTLCDEFTVNGKWDGF